MRILLCDDDPVFLDTFAPLLRQALEDRGQQTDLVCCPSARRLFAALAEQPADALFLDIDMPDTDGFAVASQLDQYAPRPLLVFTTSMETLVFSSFQHDPVWYLLKRNLDQLPAVVEKLIEKVSAARQSFQVTIANQLHTVPLSDILYFESDNHSVLLHTTRETLRFRGKLSDVEPQLPPPRFIRCHASFLVNSDCIKVLGKTSLLLADQTTIPVSRTRWNNTQASFMQYKGSLRL